MPNSAPKPSVYADVKTLDQREVLEAYIDAGSYLQAAKRLRMHPEQVKRIARSPQGAFQLEQLQRERARLRVVHLAAVADKLLAEMDACLQHGNEHQLQNRKDGEPFTIFLRPNLGDIAKALATATHQLSLLNEALSTVDLADHDVSHESRAANLETLKALVSAEERRLLHTPVALEHLVPLVAHDSASVLEESPASVLGLPAEARPVCTMSDGASTAKIDDTADTCEPGIPRVSATSDADSHVTVEENPQSFQGVATGVARPPTRPRPSVGGSTENRPANSDEVREEDLT